MKKILIPIVILTGLSSCKKENNAKDEKLEILIKNKDIKGIEAYKERQKFKIDSLNQVMLNIDENLVSMGVVPDASGVVSTQKLEISNFVHNVEIQGNVTTDQDVKVQPQFSGTLSLFVKKGQNVKSGQVIGRVADGGLRDQYLQAQNGVTAMKAQIAAAQSNTNLSKIAYEKQAALWKQKIGSEFQFLQAKANYEAAQKSVSALNSQAAGLERAADAVKANLAKTAIVAPFSGVIDEVITQNGQIVSPGTDIVKLISLGTMRVEADVPESYLAKVRQGTSAKIFLPTLNQTISSSVRLVGNYINPTNRTFKIEIPISNNGGVIKPNLLAQVKIEDYVNPNAIQVGQQYIYEDASKRSYVFVASNIKGKDAVAKKVFVNPGEKSENSVEITTGLKAGDIIITDGSKNLSDGQKVKLAQ
ncbi:MULTISPECIES: efflux RND transporter periplasmic adaptor subunit [Chryseobacterium]|uniref:Cobalt-zinc-cadmium resistance protein CzcB n=1 Tax=Chryseobacterium salivictor TaxID=2547600 RepID=A0A4P6ZHM6_9FLAO|nr:MULTISPECIES: efflux RND transporter periplasmic adaptor subunit [Chryseobacterium]MDQ0475812.1 membrane fusion protein (multidrug efflux system) [Chryseobacterium sp. MDT2-18]QBO59241.1 Cobalt-zinc-cadmium resistance protein CzcB [Chryseobacterium salivictor]